MLLVNKITKWYSTLRGLLTQSVGNLFKKTKKEKTKRIKYKSYSKYICSLFIYLHSFMCICPLLSKKFMTYLWGSKRYQSLTDGLLCGML